MTDTKKRSLAKSASWRFIATVMTILGVFLVYPDASVAIGTGVSVNVAKAFMYYLHERIWNRFDWGRIKLND